MVSTTDKNMAILIVGDPDGTLPAGSLHSQDVVVCRYAPEAVKLASDQRFTAIAVVLSCFQENSAQVAADLHSVAPEARMVLLARMYEEPSAIELVKNCRNGAGPFISDYLICPAELPEIIGRVQRPAGTSSHITQGIEDADELLRMATEDYLTGLKNRRYFDEFLIQVIERARGDNSEVSLLVLDIDGLKHYNDTWGHGVGDSVLRQAAAYIKSCCRSHDVVARMGGDEFAIIFWDVPGSNRGSQQGNVSSEERRGKAFSHPGESEVIERFRSHLVGTGQPLLGPAGIGTLAMSGGLATFPHDGSSAEELLLAADAALLHAKRSGKNRIYLVGQDDGAGA